jgi:uncharacterized membrane protein HdeD (DUF308 family)
VQDQATQPGSLRDRARALGYWVPLGRALLAAALGVALLVQPDKTRPMLVNFMGMFWLTSGLVSLRWGVSGERPRPLSLAAGVVGVLVGIAVLARNLMRRVMSEVLVISLLGSVMLLTGLLHVLGGFRTGEGKERDRSWPSLILGIFEAVLGGLLILSPTELRPGVYLAAAIWAFLGAFMLLGSGLRQRAQARQDAHARRQVQARPEAPTDDVEQQL